MKFSDLKIGTKLIMSFVIVVMIFSAVALYQIINLMNIKALEDESAGRNEDTVAVMNMMQRMREVYPIIADSVINRNFEGTREDFTEATENAENDIAALIIGEDKLVDTEQEEALGAEFAAKYRELINLFWDEMFPLLESMDLVEERAADSLVIMSLEVELGNIYAIAADGIINRNLTEFMDAFEQVLEAADENKAVIRGFADTEKEMADAEAFAENYDEYLGVIENELVPLLVSGNQNMAAYRAVDENIDIARNETVSYLKAISESLEAETQEAIADMAEIRDYDARIDALIDEAAVPLQSIVVSLKAESVEASEEFDAITNQTIMLAIIISLIGIVVAIILALLITKAITKPILYSVEISNAMANGDLTQIIEVKNKDETGQMLLAMQKMVGKFNCNLRSTG